MLYWILIKPNVRRRNNSIKKITLLPRCMWKKRKWGIYQNSKQINARLTFYQNKIVKLKVTTPPCPIAGDATVHYLYVLCCWVHKMSFGVQFAKYRIAGTKMSPILCLMFLNDSKLIDIDYSCQNRRLLK